jgi:hypothetical protein
MICGRRSVRTICEIIPLKGASGMRDLADEFDGGDLGHADVDMIEATQCE